MNLTQPFYYKKEEAWMKLPKGKLKQALCGVKLNIDRIDHIQFALPKTCFNLAETRILKLLGYNLQSSTTLF